MYVLHIVMYTYYNIDNIWYIMQVILFVFLFLNFSFSNIPASCVIISHVEQRTIMIKKNYINKLKEFALQNVVFLRSEWAWTSFFFLWKKKIRVHFHFINLKRGNAVCIFHRESTIAVRATGLLILKEKKKRKYKYTVRPSTLTQ